MQNFFYDPINKKPKITKLLICDQGSPWKAFEKAIGNIGKQKSIEDVLREQIAKNNYFEDEGSGGSEPPQRGGGGSDGSGGSDDEGLAGVMDETLQVILATLGFIFLVPKFSYLA